MHVPSDSLAGSNIKHTLHEPKWDSNDNTWQI